MKAFLCAASFLFVCFLLPNANAHFTGQGHVHIQSESKQEFLNSDCGTTDTCDLKRFTLTTSANEVWFSDDPDHPTYGNGAIMEYETASVPALEKYAIVQFKKGCVFYSSKTADGRIRRVVNDTILSFGETVPYCFKNWVIDSQDDDPAYNSDRVHGRVYLARWNRPGSYDLETQKYYGIEKPQIPVLYMTDYPSGAFVMGSGVNNAALEFKSCIYKASDVPRSTNREDVNFAKAIKCFAWKNVYVYDFERGAFQTELATLPQLEEPKKPTNLRHIPALAWLLTALILLAIAVRPMLGRREVRH